MEKELVENYIKQTEAFVDPRKLDEWESFVNKNKKILLPKDALYSKMSTYLKVLAEDGSKAYDTIANLIIKGREDSIAFYVSTLAEYTKDSLGIGFVNYILERKKLPKNVEDEIHTNTKRIVEGNLGYDIEDEKED